MNVAGRPVRKDYEGVAHFAYGWGDQHFDVLCEVHTLYAPRSTDEPEGAPATCLFCWYMVINEGAKAKGER